MRNQITNQLLLCFALMALATIGFGVAPALGAPALSSPVQPVAELFSLKSVRLLSSPFTPAVAANREYMLALDPDRLLAPFRREAGLTPRKPSYGNWESGGLDGHTAGHYLSALADMVASGNDTRDGELTVKFAALQWLAGGVFDVRILRTQTK